MKSSFRRRVGRGVGVAALAALLPLVFAMPAEASESVDQSVVLTNWLGYQWNIPILAQTFTAKVGGQVDRVSLPVSTPTHFGMFTVWLYNADPTSGQPTTAIRSAPLSTADLQCCGFTDYFFSPTVQVTSGTSYAIVVQVLAGNVKWLDSGDTVPYAGGHEWMGLGGSWLPTSHGDFGFKEWVVGGTVNQPPTLTVDRAVLSSPEGSSATATNGGSCGDPDGDTVTLTASAGTVSACSAGRWSWSLATPDELPLQMVTIKASDGTLTQSANFTLAVTGVNPTAQIAGSPATTTVIQNTDVAFTGTATSPDAADSAAGFNFTWTVTANAAVYATGSGPAFSFVPKDAGTYLVALTATDDGLMSGNASVTVIAQSVQQALKSIEGLVQGLPGLNAGQKNSLSVKLENAAAAAARGDNNAASNELVAFLNELQAYVDSGKLTPAQAEPLRLAVNAVRESLGTFDPITESLPLEA